MNSPDASTRDKWLFSLRFKCLGGVGNLLTKRIHEIGLYSLHSTGGFSGVHCCAAVTDVRLFRGELKLHQRGSSVEWLV